MAEQVATAEPVIAPKSADATTVMTARLPLTCPKMEFAIATSLFVIPLAIRFPANMKKGMASRAVLLMPVNIF